MSLLRFIVIVIVFILLLAVSLQNADLVTVRLFTLYAWQAPLVFVILVAFAIGVALGLIASAIKVVRLKRQIARMRREHHRAQAALPPARGPAPGTAPASGAGFEPPTTPF
jgi:uncharacterized integral membrane protein